MKLDEVAGNGPRNNPFNFISLSLRTFFLGTPLSWVIKLFQDENRQILYFGGKHSQGSHPLLILVKGFDSKQIHIRVETTQFILLTQILYTVLEISRDLLIRKFLLVYCTWISAWASGCWVCQLVWQVLSLQTIYEKQIIQKARSVLDCKNHSLILHMQLFPQAGVPFQKFNRTKNSQKWTVLFYT